MRRVVWDVMEETWMLADTTDHLLDQARVHSIFGVTGAAAYVVVCIQLWVHSNHTGLTPGQTCHWTWHDGVSDAAHQLHHSTTATHRHTNSITAWSVAAACLQSQILHTWNLAIPFVSHVSSADAAILP